MLITNKEYSKNKFYSWIYNPRPTVLALKKCIIVKHLRLFKQLRKYLLPRKIPLVIRYPYTYKMYSDCKTNIDVDFYRNVCFQIPWTKKRGSQKVLAVFVNYYLFVFWTDFNLRIGGSTSNRPHVSKHLIYKIHGN